LLYKVSPPGRTFLGIGTWDELVEKLAALHRAGLGQIMVMQDLVDRYEVLERIGKGLVGQIP
jgi:alkanesulfonate monooxygenase SsuD/methylene tetrahydromethanopterin reductase-like flavin-dependent oxidoreductase (luciferase family)